MVRAHYVDYVDVTYAEKTAETVLSLNADFSSEIPSSTFPVNFYFGPDIKIFRNGRSRAVRSRRRVPEKSEKSVLSLDTRFSSGIRPGPSLEVFHEVQKSRYSETAIYGLPECARPGVPSGLVTEISEKSVLSLDTRFSSGIRPGPSLVV